MWSVVKRDPGLVSLTMSTLGISWAIQKPDLHYKGEGEGSNREAEMVGWHS